MVSIEQLRNDNRFYIDDFNLNRIYKHNIVKYTVKKINIGSIIRIYRGKIIELYQTDVYKYLSGKDDDKVSYDSYCERINMSRRSPEEYDKLISVFKKTPYDIKKGAVVVDNNNVILEGQHRCCIMLKMFGPDYVIDVVQLIKKKPYSPLVYLRLLVFKFKRKLNHGKNT